MSTIDNLTKNFQDILEWRHFCEAQFKTITKLTKQIDNLEKENEELKKLLNQSTLIDSEGKLTVYQEQANNLTEQGLSSAEIICHLEISKLKQISLRQELSMEETKKLDILVKSLQNLQSINKKNTKEIEVQETSTLLKLLEESNSDETK